VHKEECLLDVWTQRSRDGPLLLKMVSKGRPSRCEFATVTTNGTAATLLSVEAHVIHETTRSTWVTFCKVPLAASIVRVHGRTLPIPGPAADDDGDSGGGGGLSAVILFRIWKEDQMNMTLLELEEWIEAMLHAGATRIYAYDNADGKDERMFAGLKPYIAAGIVRYHVWPTTRLYSYPFSQKSAYTHALYRYGNASEWFWQTDLDEVPLIRSDATPGYLLRFARRMKRLFPNVTRFHLQSVYFG
jgi:hypothetical protein